jgi:hypothetical protein
MSLCVNLAIFRELRDEVGDSDCEIKAAVREIGLKAMEVTIKMQARLESRLLSFALSR